MSGRSEQIATTICEAILSHRLVPGAKLGERELSEIFQVSRIVIRQALIRLSEDGLVTVERNRGAFVAKPSLAEAVEVFETLTKEWTAAKPNRRSRRRMHPPGEAAVVAELESL